MCTPRTPPGGAGSGGLLHRRLFCLTCLRARGLLPSCCPYLPRLLRWALCEARTGRRSCGPDPPSPDLLSLAASGCAGCGAGGKQPVSLKVPYSEGEPFGDSSQTPPASLEVPEAPARLRPGPARPSGFSPASPWPSRFSRMDPVGGSSAPEHSQGAEQEERGAHGAAAPSPPRQSRRSRPGRPPALPNHGRVSGGSS